MKKRGRKARCVYCGSTRTIHKGTRRTSQLGDRPLRFCNDCRRKFTLGGQGSRHKATPSESTKPSVSIESISQ